MIYDFAIVGAGMAGASLAAELASHASVLLLEAEETPGYHSTGRSAAFWSECYGGPDIVPLTVASGPFLREHGLLNRRGALHLATAAQSDLLDAFEEEFAGTAAKVERLDRARFEDAISGLKPQWTAAIREPECADIDVAGLHQLYLGMARRHGADLGCRARVSAIARGDGWELRTEDRKAYRARTVVNAAGAWADVIARMAGIAPLGIAPFARTVAQLRTDPAPPATMPLVLGIDETFYFKPENGRIWLSPHDEIPGPPADVAPEELPVAEAIARFESVVDWRIAAVERRWAGLRSFAPDRLPVYGPDARDPSFVWFAGQGGFGIQTAPAAARLTAQLLLGQPRDAMTEKLEPARYSPQRFA